MSQTTRPIIKKSFFLLLSLVWLSVMLRPAEAIPSLTFDISVDRFDDSPAASACTAAANDCSLRGAITFVNNVTAGSIVNISMPAGTYTLTTIGGNEDANATGDLDFTRYATITLSGAEIGPTIIDGNHADRVIDNRTGNLTLEHLTVQSGDLIAGISGGGGIINRGGRTLTLYDVLVTGNVVAGSANAIDIGGGIANYGDLYVTASQITDNSACGGGGLANYNGLLIMDHTYVARNEARSDDTCGDGGGITTLNPGIDPLELTYVQISDNSAKRGGGMFVNQDDTIITDSTFNDNTATNNGGGLYNYAEITLERVTLTHNQADGYGGGIANSDALTLKNVTVSDNGANSGGGLYNASGGPTITLDHCTIANNTASIAGAAYYGWTGSMTSLHNTILASLDPGNTWATAGVAAMTNLGYNLCSDSSCPFSDVYHDLVNVDPRLGPLAYYGGSNSTHSLLADSPGIDAADPAITLATDQRGFPRRDGDRNGSLIADIGAFEYSPVAWLPMILKVP